MKKFICLLICYSFMNKIYAGESFQLKYTNHTQNIINQGGSGGITINVIANMGDSVSLFADEDNYTPWPGSWYFNGVAIGNLPQPDTLSFIVSQAGIYSVYGNFGWWYQYTVCLTLFANIIPQGSTTFCQGGSVQLNASTGAGYTYQWKKSATNISGAASASYTATTTGYYSVQVTIPCGTATSSTVLVLVNALPSATITPSGPTTFCSGGSVLLNAPVAASRTYQWKKNGANISGATLSSYTANASGTYKVTVMNTVNGCTNISATGITVTKNPLPAAAITPPGTISFCAGQSALLTANNGTGHTYKWKKNGSYISGATSQTYIVTTAGKYRVEVTNSNGCSKTSNADTIVVPCREGESVSESEALDMMIYPNPSVDGQITVQFSDKPSAPVTIEITDVIGKVVDRFVVNDESVVSDKSNLVPGVYYLAARNKEMMVVKKLMIQ